MSEFQSCAEDKETKAFRPQIARLSVRSKSVVRNAVSPAIFGSTIHLCVQTCSYLLRPTPFHLEYTHSLLLYHAMVTYYFYFVSRMLHFPTCY